MLERIYRFTRSFMLVGQKKMGKHPYYFYHQLFGVCKVTLKSSTNLRRLLLIKIRSPLVSSMLAPAVPIVSQEFKSTSNSFSTFVVSIFVLGFASGSPILAPLSEVYGRLPIYHLTNVLFIVSLILCGVVRNSAMLLAFRFLSGFVGVAAIAIGPGSIADMMRREERGRAVSIWAVGTILGPMIGPIIGGYVTEVLGWRWMFWIIAIIVSYMNSPWTLMLILYRLDSLLLLHFLSWRRPTLLSCWAERLHD